MNSTKTCSKCNISKSLDEFHNDKSRKDGKTSYCKECAINHSRRYYQEHKEERRKQGIKYYREHREETAEYGKKYNREHKEERNRKSREYYQGHQEELNKKSREYYKEHNEDLIEYGRNYYEEFGREKQGKVSMYEDKTCSLYLGVVIAERLCRHLFRDVEVMPHGNTGYDIICNKGKKIDVKSSTTLLNHGKHPYWKFNINHNIIADFFICVAFDNVEDLNPIHLFMIPGKEVNDQGSISSTPSKIHKWNKWKRSIEEVQLCCAKMRNK